ncbi:uncharacterized protein GGS22DRAFT_194819 [Annulohypoxylon maeteangense]|uniref:uncharacterized protein n=1 Tax=Annulohypoxylon maeteangense TaxID=1927788 RepID=UPI0020076DEC|nr:uncharacterized protein GGS22DRAFT_194819 [Annulohypoxylon maeteangense]KAI0884268.1 hypothetical protein GGS22DRAFT_194819 [Annulohypoxylon maeteangense]
MADATQNDSYWTKAQNRLSDKDKMKLQMILNASPFQTPGEELQGPQNQVPWPEKLRKLCENRREEYRENRWKIKIKGKERTLHDLWDEAVSILGKLKEVGTVATSSEPMASLGWSIAWLFIQIPTRKIEVAQSVTQGLNKVVIIMSRGLIYEWHLQNSWKTGNDRNTELFENFIVDLYEQTLIFLIAASDHYTSGLKGAVARTWASVWKANAITDFEENTIKIQLDLQDEAATCFRIGVQGSLASILESQGALQTQLARLKDIHEDTKMIKEAVMNKGNYESNQKRSSVLEWLSKLPYIDHHTSAKDKRVFGTGNWIFEHEDFKNWHDSVEQHILWIHGIRGAGKTKLISRIIDQFDKRLLEDAAHANIGQLPDLQVAFFYCAGYDHARKSCIDILRSFIKQLAEPRDVLPQKVTDIYDKKHPVNAPSQQVGIEDCRIMLNDTIRHHNNVLLIIDALDECHEEYIQSLISIFDTITQQKISDSRIKVIISSRDLPVIANQMERYVDIKISEGTIKDDIKKFIDHRLKTFQKGGSSKITPNLQAKIVSTLSNKSGAMFQYASVHLENILLLPTTGEIEDALGSPPKDIVEVYRDTINIINSDPDWGPYVMRAFAWIQACGGSSSPDHLVAAASQKPKQIDVDQFFVVELHELLQRSRYLLAYEHGTVRFSHLSVQDYFAHNKEMGALDIRTTVFLRTLLNYESCQTIQPAEVTRLYDDACEYWYDYVKPLEGNKGIQPFLSRLLKFDPREQNCPRWQVSLANWTVSMFSLGYFGARYEYGSIIVYMFLPGWLPSTRKPSYDCWKMVHGEIGPRKLMETLTVRYFTAFQKAVKALSDPYDRRLIRLLGLASFFNFESQENEENHRGDKSSNRAAMAVNEQSTLTAISKMISWTFRRVLILAYTSTRNDILRRISCELWQLNYAYLNIVEAVQKKIFQDIPRFLDLLQFMGDIPSEWMEELARVTFLVLIDQIGRNGIVRPDQPVRSMVNQVLQKYDLFRPLEEHQHLFLDTSKLRLNHPLVVLGDLPEQPSTLYEPKFIKLVIQNGADVNLQVTPELDRLWATMFAPVSGTPLIGAMETFSIHGPEIMEFLLENGANVNQKAIIGRFGTVLIAACALSIGDAVERLLKLGDIDVDVVAPTGVYGTALIAALNNFFKGCANTVKMLLDRGADPRVRAQHGAYVSAFAAALHFDDTRIALRLLDYSPETDEDAKRSLQAVVDEFSKLRDFSDNDSDTQNLKSVADALKKKVADLYIECNKNFDWRKIGYVESLYVSKGITAAASLTCSLRCIQFDRHSDLAEKCRLEAARFLSRLSMCMGSLPTARIILFCFGYPNQDMAVVEAWQKVLDESQRAGEDYDWETLADSLRDLVHSIPSAAGEVNSG